jgi:hypothetical protein
VIPRLFSPDHSKLTEGLGGPLNDLSDTCLGVVIHCAIHAKDENKGDCTVLNLFHKHLGTSVLSVNGFLPILFHNFFVILVVLQTT